MQKVNVVKMSDCPFYRNERTKNEKKRIHGCMRDDSDGKCRFGSYKCPMNGDKFSIEYEWPKVEEKKNGK